MATIGAHVVTVGGVDVSCLIDTVSINHGRDEPGAQPEASSVTLDFTTDAQDSPLPAAVEIGATVVVVTSTATVNSTRFTGRLTDLTLGWDDAGEDTPDTGVGQMVAVGVLADLGRRVVGDAPFPQELDGARVNRVMTAAGITLDPLYSDPGTVQILARDIDSQPALSVAQDCATSASGVVWQSRAGDVRYADAVHRRGIAAALVLDSCDILVTPTWRRTLEGLVNQVSVGYGVAPDGGEQPRYVNESAVSVGKYGRYNYTTTTELAALADAQAFGDLLLARNSTPVWVMASLPIDVPGLTAADYDALLGLDMHSLLTLTGLPSISTAPTTANLWVEGWKETLAYGTHEIELVVSGYCRTVPAPTWDYTDPSWLWGGITLNELRRNRATNPALRGGNGNNVTVRTNLATNPSNEAAGVNWSTNNGANWAHSLDTTQFHSGTKSVMSTPQAPIIGTQNTIMSAYNVGGGVFPATVGTIYTASVWMRSNVAALGDARIYWLDSGNAVIGSVVIGTAVNLPADTWVRASVTATAPANTVSVRVGDTINRASGNVQGTDRAWLDDCLVEASGGAVLPYFDGTTPPDAAEGIIYSFSGTAHASTSLAVAANANVAAWSVSGGVVYRAPDGRVRFLSKSAGGAILYPSNTYPATPADTWSGAAVVTGAGGQVRMELDTYNAAFANTKVNPGAYVPCSAGGVRPVCEAVSGALIPSDTTGIRTILRWDTAGGTYTVSDVIAEKTATIGAYFDGSTPDTTDLDYSWAGAVDASESVLSEILPQPGGVPPSMTWDDAACFGPPIDRGRWDDQPSTLRWDQLATTITWNNYPPTGV